MKAGCPDAIKYCKPFLQKLSPQIRGTLVTDIRSTEGVLDESEESEGNRNEKELPNNIAAMIRSIDQTLPTQAAFATRMTLGGLIYSVSSTHAGNGNILVREAGQSMLHPAKIENILKFKNQTIVLVRYHLPATGIQACDLFSRYPVLNTTVWDVEVGDLSAIKADQIVCHFAELRTTWARRRVMIALSLSRVRFLIGPDRSAYSTNH